MEQALVDKLGDLGEYNPKELTAHIRKTFETFDEDGSGEISSSELADAFRSMGMEIPGNSDRYSNHDSNRNSNRNSNRDGNRNRGAARSAAARSLTPPAQWGWEILKPKPRPLNHEP